MIPKKIHWCWFTDKIPDNIQRYINTWKTFMPDYEIIRWSANNFDIHSVKWVEQAVEAKRWAFAADYVRLWALYNQGGIYLDSDVEVLKSFDGILQLPYFLGREHSKGIIEMAVLGAEPKCEWIKDCLDYYKDRDFIMPNGELSIEPIPHIMLRILGKKYVLKRIKNIQEFNKNSKEIQILPVEFFSPKAFDSKKFTATKNTYTVHYFEKSWNPPKRAFSNLIRGIKYSAKKIIGEKAYQNLLWKIYAEASK